MPTVSVPALAMTTPAPLSDQRTLRVFWRRLRWKLHWALRPNQLFVVRPWWDGMTLVFPGAGQLPPPSTGPFRREAIAAMDVAVAAARYDRGRCRRPRRGVLPVVGTSRGAGRRGARHRAAAGVRLARRAERCAERAPSAQGVHPGPRRGGRISRAARRSAQPWAGARSRRRRPEGSTVAASTLDASLATSRSAAIDLLKLDAAGNELAVLRGARPLLDGGAIAQRHLQALPPGRHRRAVRRRRRSRRHDGSPAALRLPGRAPGRPAGGRRCARSSFRGRRYSVPALARRRTGPGP